MNNLNKMEVFKKCGFGDASINYGTSHMPHIQFNGYDKVMDYCYQFGYSERAENLVSSWELVKKVKDLETANARLLERNHELQVDNEESSREVEDYSKRNQALLQRNISLVVENNALRDNYRDKLEVIENLQSLLDNARDEITAQYNNAKIINDLIEDLRKVNGDLTRAGLKSQKYKFVITVEEF